MKERNGADPGPRSGSGARLSEHAANGPQEYVQRRAGDRGVVVQEGPGALRRGEYPPAHGKRWKDVIDEMGCGLDHPAGVAGRTHAAARATERS